MAKDGVKGWVLRHDSLAKAVGFGVAIVLLLLIALLPSIQSVGEPQSKIKVREREEEKLTSKMRVLSGMDKDALAERLEILDSALPPRKDVVLYLATVDGLSRELGLSFTGISLAPGDVTEASASSKTRKQDIVKGVHVLETEIKINGTREKIYEFLRVLELTSPLMQITKVEVASLGLQEDSYVLSLRLGMLWASKDITTSSGVVELFTDKEELYFQDLADLRQFESSSITEQSEGIEGTGKYDLFAPILLQSGNPLPQESEPLESQELVQE